MLGVGIDVPGPAPSLRSVPQDRAQPVQVDQDLRSVGHLYHSVNYPCHSPPRRKTASQE
jgi:hypothetical protein